MSTAFDRPRSQPDDGRGPSAPSLESLLRDATEHAIIATDEHGLITFFNTGAERMLGWPASEIIGRERAAIFLGSVPGEATATEDELLRRTRAGKTCRCELRSRAGERIPVSITITRSYDATGSTPTGYLAVAQDISELITAEKAVAASDVRFRAMVQHASDGIVVIDGTGRILYASPAAEELVGMPEGAALGTNVLDVVHPPDLTKAAAALRNTASAPGHQPRIELRLQSCDGALRHVELVANSLLDDPAVRGIVLNVRDISERREIDRLKDEFVSVVSHELRTPLTSIRGALGLLVDGAFGDIDLEARRLVEMADRNAEHLTRLIEQILELEALEAGAVILETERVRPEDAFVRAVESTLGMAAARDVTVRIAGVVGTDPLLADPHRLHQVLLNLISNSVKFSDPGQEVHLTAEQAGTFWELAVLDSGRGIPSDRLERVFNRFEQVDSSDRRSKQGSGLGLAISAAIVDLHGGVIAAESGHGTTRITFTLPTAPPDPGGGHR